MEKATRVLAFVLAGGEGKRLAPLTRHVAKPAVPFNTHYRLIDFALSNLCNSDVRAIHVLMQYQPQSVLQHLMECWRTDQLTAGSYINPIIGGIGGLAPYAGTADAVFRNRELIMDFMPDVVAVFSADHVYRMDVRQMIEFHLSRKADVSVATLPVPLADAHGFGVIETDESGRIRRFSEKPAKPAGMPGRPSHALASMGNYLFSPAVLLEALDATHARGETDFGGHLLPSLVGSRRLLAYDFTAAKPKWAARDGDAHYWRDVGTVDAYFAANMDTLGDSPRFPLTDHQWPIRGALPPSDAAVAEGPFANLRSLSPISRSSQVERIVLRQGARIGEGARLTRCIVGENVQVGAGCRLRNVIIDQDNHLPEGLEAGFYPELDRERWPVSDTGIVVIPRGYFAPSTQSARRRGLPAAAPLPFALSPAWAARGPDVHPSSV